MVGVPCPAACSLKHAASTRLSGLKAALEASVGIHVKLDTRLDCWQAGQQWPR